MKRTAAWQPGWYNLDQGLAIGEHRDYLFYPKTDDANDDEELIFVNTCGVKDSDRRGATVESIRHPALGWLDRVHTADFGEYTFTFSDGWWVRIETEEDIGHVNAASEGAPLEQVGRLWAGIDPRTGDPVPWTLQVALIDVTAGDRRGRSAGLE